MRARRSLLILLLAAEPSLGGPTVEQVQQVIMERGVPSWRKAAETASAVRAVPPTEVLANKWARLDAETDARTGKTPLIWVMNPADDGERWQNATWLRWRILTQNADGRYSYAYALNLSQMRDSNGDFLKEAALFLFHARVALAIDGARCVDPSSPDAVITAFEVQESFRAIADKAQALPPRERAFALLEAVSIEEMRGERPPAGWLCKQGSRAIAQAMHQGGGFEQRKPAAGPATEGQLGSTYQIDVSKVEPEFVADEVWRKRRRDTLDRQIKSAADKL